MSPLELSRNFNLIRTWRLSRQRLPSLQRLMPELAEQDIHLEALRQLPVTGKLEYRERAQEWLETNAALPHFMIRTGGTTGAPTLQWGYMPPYAPPPAPSGEEPRPLYLKAGDGRQGTVPHFPKDVGSLIAPLRDIEGYRIMTEILQTRYRFAGYEEQFSRLSIPLPAAKKLVHYILLNNIGVNNFGLREVHTNSSFVSRAWRRRIETVLQAKLIDHYGFTEIQTARAHECPSCGYYHFPDSIYPEVVDLRGNLLSAPHANGRLLVTRLLEENDCAMPVLRFDSGDIAEIGVPCAFTGETGFKPWGKIDHSIGIDGGAAGDLYPVRYGDIQDAIDSSAVVARIDNIRHSLVTLTEGDTFPKWRLLPCPDAANQARLEIEMLFDPRLFTDEWAQFEADLRARLDANNPDYRRAIDHAGFHLHIAGLPPGSLSDRDVMKS
ncbi:hypothetical protein HF313_26060 [Massilia atriviolacea]|uniref:Phenylacetate--CoA ligase family protein n=1 Tax=Massilia atriviolacea TaxID=2495579 RepID=A0A430HMY7_9BURK|nr:hypothetical protein [Massilia atriviolacea]RSZ58870.1 hypothetical protein EJB06_11035 [Massilia atriviolacea]